MKYSTHFAGRRGFSLIELMVSIVVGMLAIMFATKLVISAEQNKNASIGGSDAMQNGMLAMFSISKDAGQAGWGLNDPLIAGCDTKLNDNNGFKLASVARGAAGSAVTVTPLAAAVIVSNGTAPDQIYLYSGTSMSGTGNVRMVNSSVAGASTLVASSLSYGFLGRDVIVVAPETAGASQCSIAQLSSADGSANLYIATGSNDVNRFNGPSGIALPYTGGATRIFDLGDGDYLSLHAWSVKNGFLQLQASEMPGGASGASTVADNIVSIKAEYGFDTRTAATFTPASGMQIGSWSQTMIDADGDGIVAGAGDFQRVSALRIAVIARSKNPDKPGATGACTAGKALTIFGSAEPTGVTAAPITLALSDLAVAGDAINASCYHYRAFETIVPLRNAGWRPSE